jgi:hypothetical protein
MHRVAIGQYDQAWDDCLATWRLGGRIAAGPTLIEKLVGIAMRGVARNATLALLQSKCLPEELAQRILSDLNAMPSATNVTDAINNGERMMFLDSVLRMIGKRKPAIDPSELGSPGDPAPSAAKFVSVDINVPMRMANQWYDRLTRISKISDRVQRNAELAQFESDIGGIAGNVKLKFVGGLFSQAKRSEIFGDILLANFLPAVTAAYNAQDRDEANLILMKVAAALAVKRAETGQYPESLNELTPNILPVVPNDPYSGKPLIYKRRGEGYLLYSVFQNGVDDSGSDAFSPIVHGEWTADPEFTPPDPSAADLVIRLSLPPPKWPVQLK